MNYNEVKVNKLLGAPLAERFLPTLVPDLDNTSVGKHHKFYNHIRGFKLVYIMLCLRV
ncbi:hypothetical protein SDC9_92116 [bioreactor metagenome]|uniref:Uncharacterized protein n=1 Tax=bioreactor metagenome TaxID=1076179 RepID=A0A644ZWT9_9ZZZZ